MAKNKRPSGKAMPREGPTSINPVAKHAHKTNRCIAFRDRGKYTRKGKHKGQEPWPIVVFQPLLARAVVFPR